MYGTFETTTAAPSQSINNTIHMLILNTWNNTRYYNIKILFLIFFLYTYVYNREIVNNLKLLKMICTKEIFKNKT